MFGIILLFVAAFLLQYALTFLQMQSFTKVYKEYRYEGWRAAIGKFKGAVRAGAIVMFAIDKDGVIVKGTAMQGVTILARFRSFDRFNGRNVGDLSEQDCRDLKLSSSMTRAVVDANRNYLTIMSGEEVPMPPSPMQKAGNFLTGGFRRLRKSSS